ncbi:hypothetical protein [Streptomyces sp. NPDC001415]
MTLYHRYAPYLDPAELACFPKDAGMTESSFECQHDRAEQGIAGADRPDLVQHLQQISWDTNRLRNALAEAVVQEFAGIALPGGLGEELPYPADRVERLLFDDVMGGQVLVGGQAVATALRHAMRLLEEAADAASLARVLLERADNAAPIQFTSQLEALYARLTP